MADTTTTNYGLTKPAVNDPAGDSAWGGKLNTNFDVIDTNLKRVDNAASSGGGGAPSAVINGATGTTVTAVATDKGKVYILAGSGTLSLPAAVQVAGWYAWVKKTDNTGAWAVTPASIIIDGLASINCYQESFVIWYDSANSVFRTQNRQKGWINLGTTTVTSTVTSLTFTLGFADTELRDMQFDAEGLTFNSADSLSITFAKNGGTVTTNYINQHAYTSGSTAGAFGNTTSYWSTFYNTGTIVGGVYNIWQFASTSYQRYDSSSWMSGGGSDRTDGMQTTAAAIQSVTMFAASNSNITAGRVNQKAFRP